MAGFRMPGSPAGLALALLVTPVAPSSVDRRGLDDPSSVARPGYLIPVADPGLGSVVMRITNDPGAATAPVPGTWGSDARHVYSKQQPWNSDQTLLTIENRSGGSPTPLILDGTTYAPRYAPCPNYDLWDYRWHPSLAHPHEQINVNRAGTELMWFDVTTCTKTRTWTLPSGGDDTTADLHRIFEVDPGTLALQPHRMSSGSLRCGSFQARPNGWIFPLKHADMALGPFGGHEDVIVGGRACPGSSLSNVVMV